MICLLFSMCVLSSRQLTDSIGNPMPSNQPKLVASRVTNCQLLGRVSNPRSPLKVMRTGIVRLVIPRLQMACVRIKSRSSGFPFTKTRTGNSQIEHLHDLRSNRTQKFTFTAHGIFSSHASLYFRYNQESLRRIVEFPSGYKNTSKGYEFEPALSGLLR